MPRLSAAPITWGRSGAASLPMAPALPTAPCQTANSSREAAAGGPSIGAIYAEKRPQIPPRIYKVCRRAGP